MDGLFKIIDDGIEKRNKVFPLIAQLLSVINEDKDGDYFICKENKELIDSLKEHITS